MLSSAGPTLFNASSFASYSLPDYGHLHSGLGTGAWCAEKQDKNQYLQVNLVENFIVAGVATQGQKHFDGWVTSYSVLYSVNHQLWDEYPVDGRSKTLFTGNKDRDTTVLHLFKTPVVARYVRFVPETWSGKICMRVQIYGCAILHVLSVVKMLLAYMTFGELKAVFVILDIQELAPLAKTGMNVKAEARRALTTEIV